MREKKKKGKKKEDKTPEIIVTGLILFLLAIFLWNIYNGSVKFDSKQIEDALNQANKTMNILNGKVDK